MTALRRIGNGVFCDIVRMSYEMGIAHHIQCMKSSIESMVRNLDKISYLMDMPLDCDEKYRDIYLFKYDFIPMNQDYIAIILFRRKDYPNEIVMGIETVDRVEDISGYHCSWEYVWNIVEEPVSTQDDTSVSSNDDGPQYGPLPDKEGIKKCVVDVVLYKIIQKSYCFKDTIILEKALLNREP